MLIGILTFALVTAAAMIFTVVCIRGAVHALEAEEKSRRELRRQDPRWKNG